MSIESYPECEKLTENRERVDDLMEFLLFLNKNGVQFGKHRDCINNTPYLDPINLERSGEVLAAKFLGIDMSKVDEERTKIERSIQSN
ncbi:hypothetical protein [Vibrio barjaei]|uniref:hypothetical protein n=1 Tax=Vibrio barjaei TaxID=1676683 RepID=UPI002284B116|nr:hypothetical protein [Vibrio barjaei]MCY9874519.1 hypothetical protein [Vibrio barjaei]